MLHAATSRNREGTWKPQKKQEHNSNDHNNSTTLQPLPIIFLSSESNLNSQFVIYELKGVQLFSLLLIFSFFPFHRHFALFLRREEV